MQDRIEFIQGTLDLLILQVLQWGARTLLQTRSLTASSQAA